MSVVLGAALAVTGAAAPAGGQTASSAPAVSSAPSDLPRGSVRHQNSQFWVWFGPRNWTSIDSKQGITISSGNGLLNVDYGFSSTICANGRTVAESVGNYYAQARASLRASLRANWRRVRMRVSQIQQRPVGTYGPLYFRQAFRVSGRAQGIPFRGEIQMDYSLATGPTYCFVRNEARTAPADGFRASIRQLRSVQNAMAYFGPGAPGDEGYTDPVR